MKHRQFASDLCLLLIAFVWGSTFLVVQHAVFVLPPLAFNAVRFAGAALLFGLVALLSRKRRRGSRSGTRALLLHGALLGVFLFGGYAFQTIGLVYTTTTNAGFITGLSVVLVPFISLRLAKQRLQPPTWIAAVLALAGLYFLAFNGGAVQLNEGDGFVLLCSFCFALHIAFTGKYAAIHNTVLLVTVQFAVVALAAASSSFLFEPQLTGAALWEALTEPKVIVALLISICISTAFAYWAQTWCQQYTSASRVAVIFAMEPVFAAITGVTFAGETLGLWAIVGCLLILAGMIVVELKWGRHAVQ
ncbi:DMT family transporter [Paenibacillus dendritiformis]|uniref:EamA domain-containing protein n=1 Tax=Paenibacillus dendritiformis C454 TaxID=1131935 RepID=H3SJ75_9BACL|nr:DMT family transporter [Paenibacillus dendritiformis]EHQ60855.1 hypothetical protein PDENDC454_18003 [Paenibacillus dendritiformis C454]CAH8772759.1 DMT family transporter [Paenibacillus dendritiformis]